MLYISNAIGPKTYIRISPAPSHACSDGKWQASPHDLNDVVSQAFAPRFSLLSRTSVLISRLSTAPRKIQQHGGLGARQLERVTPRALANSVPETVAWTVVAHAELTSAVVQVAQNDDSFRSDVTIFPVHNCDVGKPP